MALAISSGVAARPLGCFAAYAVRLSSGMALNFEVAVKPGATALTRIPISMYSNAACLVRPTTACFAATYGANPGSGLMPDTETTLTIAPPPQATSWCSYVQCGGDSAVLKRKQNEARKSQLKIVSLRLENF